MAKKEKPKNKSKPRKGRKKTKAQIKAERKIKEIKDKADKAHRAAMKANTTAMDYSAKVFNTKDPKLKAKYTKKFEEYMKKYHADMNRYKKYKNQLKPAKTKKKRVNKTKTTDQAAMVSKIEQHKKEFTNEGNMAIFPTLNGTESDIVFFSPTNTESESNSSNITSYAVDQGAPRKDYARFNSKTVTIDGLISDDINGGRTAHDKWVQLRTWHSHHEELTFRGDIYYKHLLISQLDRQFTGFKNTMQVSITFTFVRAAEITTSGKKKNAKRSKSSKTLAGNRNKNYTAITIKPGDTLWGLSKRYGKSVSWLQKVNKIKNPNRIYAGNLIYVNDKKHKAKSKIRVK